MEDAPGAGLALQRHVAVHRPGQPAADRQSQARARRLVQGLTELLEDRLVLRRLDPGAGVPHRDVEPVVPARDLHVDSATVRELQGVPDEVDQDLADPLPVEHHLRRRVGVLPLERESLLDGQ